MPQCNLYRSLSIFFVNAIIPRRTEQTNNAVEEYHVGTFASSSRSNSGTNPKTLLWPNKYVDNSPVVLARTRKIINIKRILNTLPGKILSSIMPTSSHYTLYLSKEPVFILPHFLPFPAMMDIHLLSQRIIIKV
jgi:hypothetical protein